MPWPEWFHWELGLTPHAKKRMLDRDFTEVDLRDMLEHATGYRADVVQGRWVIESRHRGIAWEVIVDPDERSRKLVVVTAYPVKRN